MHRPSQTTRKKRPSFVLLAVLVVVALLSLAAYQFGELMLAEYHASDSSMRSAQAQAMADSGLNYAAAALSNATTLTNVLNSNPYDNAQAFGGILVNPQDPPLWQGRFSIVAPIYPDDPAFGSQPFRLGVIDESGKINLNALMQLDSSGQIAHDMLLKLPNMTEDIANSILDWIDADDDARPNGAENDYYQTLSPPYNCKNAPLDSLEELLLVKGVTPQLLLGNDRNRNGVLEPDEDDGSGQTNPGWSEYLTVYSREQNVDAQGNPRIYVNGSDLNQLYQNLSTAVGPDLANYILAYRLYGPASTQTNPRGGRGGTSGATPRLSRNMLNLQNGRPQSISSLYALVNSQVSIPGNGPGAAATVYPSPLNDPGQLKQLLPLLLDEVTTINNAQIPARINVNTASSTVLQTLPGLSDTDVQNILVQRPNPESNEAPDPIFQTTAWLVTEANISPSKLQTLERYITARTQVYRVQVVGSLDRGGPTARIEAVIDTNQGQPRILYRRDLTELGKGFDLSSVTPSPTTP